MSNYSISSLNSKGLIENIPISKIFAFEKAYSYRHRWFNFDNSFNMAENQTENEDLDLYYSIMKNGLFYPLIVRLAEENYELLAGRRRLMACKRLGWRKVLCNIVEASDKEAYEISLNENLHTRKIDALEEAEAFRKYVFEFGWGGITELAEKISKSKSYVAKKIKMLDLPENVLSFINEGVVSPTVAEELLPIEDASKQSRLAQLIKDKQLSKTKVRRLVTDIRESDHIQEFNETHLIDQDKKTQRSFEQAITALRLAMNKISSVIEDNEDNWIIYERLMHSKHALHQQIDLLIKDRKKL